MLKFLDVIANMNLSEIKIYSEKVTFRAKVFMGPDEKYIDVKACSIVEARDLVWDKIRGIPHNGFILWRAL